MVEACFVSSSPSRHAYLEPQEADLIPLFMRMNYDTMRFFAMNRLERGRYLEVLDEYYRLHVPEFPELKSLDVLKEVFCLIPSLGEAMSGACVSLRDMQKSFESQKEKAYVASSFACAK